MVSEVKVGAFVLAGLMLLGAGIFLLGDFTVEKRYSIFATFNDVTGLAEDSVVKLSGVEVGKVRKLDFRDGKVFVEARIKEGTPIYRDAVFSVGSTGIIGSKYLQVDQGRCDSGLMRAGDVAVGRDPVSIEKALAKTLGSLQDLLGGLNGKGKAGRLADNLNASVENVRHLTANLDEMFADVKPQLTSAFDRMDGVSSKLDSLLAKADRAMGSLETGKGPVPALLNDEKMKDDVKATVSDLRETVGGVKDVLGRMNQFKIYWNFDGRYDYSIQGVRGDFGVKIVPRQGRYYYVGGANLGNESDVNRHGTDYEQKNRVDALLGFERGGWDLGLGILRSGGGARLSWRPAPDHPLWGRLGLTGQVHNFARNRTISGHLFNRPEYDAGFLARIHPLVKLGFRVDDFAEIPRYQTWLNVCFEDKDVAYLFGLVSFGAAGTKGRSKSN
jgi:phospholipid/cholesterol/gamma-HCH transport system substrate-binding protein